MTLAELLKVNQESQKVCSTCKESKPESEFHRRKDRRGEKVIRRAKCRVCVAKQKGKPGRRVRPS